MSNAKIGLYFLAAITFGSYASAGSVGCFSVSQMFESEDHRYFVDAISHCGKEIDVVYVRVAFLNELGGDWCDRSGLCVLSSPNGVSGTSSRIPGVPKGLHESRC